ncbi:sigma-70 family RNA polymerase sigma factor [Nocardioides panacisoli]|uniref:RNA polymerase sigma factor n=1 Tax=Nocardioides panacisoli TaxID=627624 RepID=UPI001C62A09F|nr:sigma-70 family RNA polymerase sigma factor [Nocardioides panacisoli]QYJ05660.1 sigma-70 family RNA polymerase sigma factor [Nocardioides panacisoli]
MATTGGTEQLWNDATRHFVHWRDGDTAAMDELVRLLTPVLWQVARAQHLDEETAGDVVQSAWLALVRNPDSVRDPVAVGRWLTTATRREAWRVARQRGRTDPVVDEDLPLPASRSAEEEATTNLRDRSLWHAVAQLSDRCQRLLRVAAFLDRPDYARLAADLDMPVGSIGPTRGRCLAKLRTLLAANGAGPTRGANHD